MDAKSLVNNLGKRHGPGINSKCSQISDFFCNVYCLCDRAYSNFVNDSNGGWVGEK